MNRPLLEWLLLRFPDTPRTRAKHWVLGGRVSLDGVVVRRPHQVMPDPGASLQIQGRGASTLDISGGWRIHPLVTLLHLDRALAIVNKGPGLISVPGETSEISALSLLEDFLAGRLRARLPDGQKLTVPLAFRRLRPLPLHRLDKFTTGVFCLVMNPAARDRLLEQLRAHEIKREYIAFAEGCPSIPKGTWRHWLELAPDGIRQRVVRLPRAKAPTGKAVEAVTRYEVLANYRLRRDGHVMTKLRLRLETGLKHQIRVQAAAEGLPLIGDRLYNPNYQNEGAAAPVSFGRQALHAALISLKHPDRHNAWTTWEAPLPPDLCRLEAALAEELRTRAAP